MASRKNQARGSKVKVGAIIDKDIVDRLKERAVREGKLISDLLEEAVTKYDIEDSLGREVRLKAMEQLFSIRFNVSDADWKNIMADDDCQR